MVLAGFFRLDQPATNIRQKFLVVAKDQEVPNMDQASKVRALIWFRHCRPGKAKSRKVGKMPLVGFFRLDQPATTIKRKFLTSVEGH